jgi:hypothetical protein
MQKLKQQKELVLELYSLQPKIAMYWTGYGSN